MQGLTQVLLHQSCRPGSVPGRQGVADRLVDQPVLFGPDGGPTVKLRQPRGLGPLQLGTEEVAEQVMEAVPAALLVQGNQERVGALQLLEQILAVGPAGDRVTERTAEPLQDRGLQQEPPHPVRLTVEDLLAEIVQDVPMGPGERVQERIRIRPFAQRQGGQLQPQLAITTCSCGGRWPSRNAMPSWIGRDCNRW